MNFNSLTYLIFFPIVLILYWIIPGKFRWILLLIASYYFYMSWNPWLAFLIAGTTLVSYLAAILIEKTEKKAWKRFWLIITLVICLGCLVFFKYINFLMNSFVWLYNLLAPVKISSPYLDLILPVGISFYTFQTLSYVIDVYWGKFKAERHLGYYALFVSFFPQLVAGPIEKPEDLLPQLKEVHHLNSADLEAGLRIMLVGFFRKCVVADLLGTYVNNVYSNLSSASALAVFLAGFFFCFQMYCDFAGYSEIAMGSARMMGIRLTKNFDRPFLSVSYSEFFRRWHITLNRWFTEYLYIPLGGSRKGLPRKVFNVFVVFILCGLWHGANWTYVLWGLYAAFFVALESLLKKPFQRFNAKRGIDVNNPVIRALRIGYMMILFSIAGLIFRSPDFTQLSVIFTRLFTVWGWGSDYLNSTMSVLGMDTLGLIQAVTVLAAMCLVYYFGAYEPKDTPAVSPLPVSQTVQAPVSADKAALSLKAEKMASRSEYAQRVSVYVYIVMAIAICWFALYLAGESSAFAYFQF
jgi:alginate O-acetyltransferase complex protein AlgI